jgi:hypothetical protein
MDYPPSEAFVPTSIGAIALVFSDEGSTITEVGF